MNFAERLVTLRKAKGISQKEVAVCLRVAVSTMSNYENGVHEPDFETLCKLADYYDVSTDYLLGRSSCIGSGEREEQQLPYSKLREQLFFETEKLSENNLYTMEKIMHIMKEYEIFVEIKR